MHLTKTKGAFKSPFSSRRITALCLDPFILLLGHGNRFAWRDHDLIALEIYRGQCLKMGFY